MLMGPQASRSERAEFRERIIADPRKYIAQHRVELSTCPTWTDDGLAPRHVDLRPYIISGRSTWVLPGGLTRTALKAGSLVVNSSQGGGSKDTWVLADPSTPVDPKDAVEDEQTQSQSQSQSSPVQPASTPPICHGRRDNSATNLQFSPGLVIIKIHSD